MATVSALAAVGVSAAAVMVLGSGCSSASSSLPTSPPSGTVAAPSAQESSSTPAPGSQEQDYSGLLITAGDLSPPFVSAFTADAPSPNPNGAPGAAVVFTSETGIEHVGDTIVVLPDAASAGSGLRAASATLGDSVTAPPTASTVGTDGIVVSGPSPDGTKSVTVLLFTERTAFITLEFDGAPGYPVSPEHAMMIGQKQDAAIKSRLPG